MTRKEMLGSNKVCYRWLKDGSLSVSHPDITHKYYNTFSKKGKELKCGFWDYKDEVWVAPLPKKDWVNQTSRFQYNNIWNGEVNKEEWFEVPNGVWMHGNVGYIMNYLKNVLFNKVNYDKK